MAVLSDADRAQLVTDIMRALGVSREQVACLKPELRAAVDAADTWCENNKVSYNSALPLPFRSVASPDQKSRLLEAVISFRRNRGS